MSAGKRMRKMRQWSHNKGKYHSLAKLAREERESERKPRVKRNGVEVSRTE